MYLLVWLPLRSWLSFQLTKLFSSTFQASSSIHSKVRTFIRKLCNKVWTLCLKPCLQRVWYTFERLTSDSRVGAVCYHQFQVVCILRLNSWKAQCFDFALETRCEMEYDRRPSHRHYSSPHPQCRACIRSGSPTSRKSRKLLKLYINSSMKVQILVWTSFECISPLWESFSMLVGWPNLQWTFVFRIVEGLTSCMSCHIHSQNCRKWAWSLSRPPHWPLICLVNCWRASPQLSRIQIDFNIRLWAKSLNC